VNRRVAEVFPDLLESVAALLEKHRITFEEYRQAIGFLEDVGRQGEFPLITDVFLGVAVDDINYAADGGTESNVEGPFYIPGAPALERPCELPRREHEPGDVLFFSGSVRSPDGTALPGAMIDMWQADAEGKYSHFYEGLPEHNLRGRFTTDEEGRFEVRTVVPAPYEIPKAGPTGRVLAALGRHCFRPAHLHFKLSHPGHELLTTQIYFKGDPWLDSDVVGAVKVPLVVRLEKQDASDHLAQRGLDRPYYACSYDFILQGRA
jgi:catechol 1,2-dioxygenase